MPAVVVVAGTLVAYVSFRLGAIPLVGFLIAGVLVGPNGLGLIEDMELVNQTAEIGVLLLLFTIGLELSLGELRRTGSVLVVGGSFQVLVTTAVVTGLLAAGGVAWNIGIYSGFLVALSSTAIVLKLLADRGQTRGERGRVAVSILIFQDLAVIAMVLIVPMLGDTGGSTLDVVWAITKAVLLVAAVLFGARRLVPGLLEAVARTCSQEVFLLAVLALCFGTAYATSLLGVNVALGAFLAGLVVSESRFSTHALNEVMPLQILFSAAFFVSIGMLLDLGFLVDEWPLVVGVVAAVVVIKTLVTTSGVWLVRRKAGVALSAALLLAQLGEFSFVLERTGTEAGLSPADLGERGSQAFIAATVVLMTVTPALSALGERLGGRLARRRRAEPEAASDAEPPEPDDLADHIVLAGYGPHGAALATALELADVPFVVTTLSPEGADHASELGRDVLISDGARARTLELAGLSRARLLVVADDDSEAAERVVAVAATVAPQVPVLVRTHRSADAHRLAQRGVHAVADVSAIDDALISQVLGRLGLPEDRIEDTIDAARQRSGPPPSAGSGAPVDLTRPVDVSVTDGCEHAPAEANVWPSAPGCAECLASGGRWVHLRICLGCGHVGCCDSSPDRHARAHWDDSGHAVMRSLEPDETWAHCYADGELMQTVDGTDGRP